MKATLNLTDGIFINVTIQGGGGGVNSNLHRHFPRKSAPQATADTIEALVLAHACAGVDVTSAAYLTGLNTVIEKLANEWM
jgi:hypothetical protein